METEQNCNILTPLLWLSALCLSCSPDAQLEARGSLCWLSLLHLISNFSGPQLIRAPRAPSAGLLYYILSSNSSNLQLSDFLSWLSYIIVQRPLNRLLDLWNGMFDRHQAEITVMQFTGHSLRCISLWVYHGNFSLSHFVSQFPPMQFPLITAIRICHFLPVHHLGMASLAESKVKIQQYNCKLFFSRIFTWSYNCLLQIIISYLKLYNCVQTNDY